MGTTTTGRTIQGDITEMERFEGILIHVAGVWIGLVLTVGMAKKVKFKLV